VRLYGVPQSTHPQGRRLFGFRHPPAHGYAAHARDNVDAKLNCFAEWPYSRITVKPIVPLTMGGRSRRYTRFRFIGRARIWTIVEPSRRRGS